MSRENNVWEMNKAGNIINTGIYRDVEKRFKADTPFDKTAIPYILMFLCATIDGAVFYSLFSMISYDSPANLVLQMAGFLFSFDVIPIFLGIYLKRYRQGLNRTRFLLWLALSICIFAVAMNVVLRICNMDLVSPDSSLLGTSLFGPVAETTRDAGYDSATISLTIFGIGMPILTSGGSFFISYLTYNPLRIKMRRLEKLLTDKKEDIRQLEAIHDEYRYEPDFREHLLEDDALKYKAMRQIHRAKVVGYSEYVIERLKEHIGDPYSNNILSAEVCTGILNRLDQELARLEGIGDTSGVHFHHDLEA